MKRLTILCTAALFLCVSSFSAFAATYKSEYSLDLVPNPQTAWGMGAQYFCDLVKERSQGRINIRPYFNSQLTAGKQTSSLMLLRNGACDFAMQGVFNWAPQVVEYNLIGMPFLMTTYAQIDAVRNGKAGRMLADITNSKGVKFLAWAENGYRVLSNSKREVTKPEDLEGMKVRVVGSSVVIETFQALGANPVNMNWNDVMSAIQQGVIDGQENPFNYLYSFRVQEYHKFLSDWHYTCDWLMFCVNPAIFASFTPEDQALIQKCADDAGKYEIAVARVGLDDGKALEYLKSLNMIPPVTDYYKACAEQGAKVVRLTPEQLQVFAQKTQSVRDAWAGKIGRELYEAALADIKTVQNK
jgi:tripartite ATP-independent transporter DctP family solute receptor